MNIYRTSGGSSRRTRWHRRTLTAAACASLVSLSIVSAGIGVTAASAAKKPTITIWYDTARKPMVQAYIKAHPKVHVVAVLKDGDSNGDGRTSRPSPCTTVSVTVGRTSTSANRTTTPRRSHNRRSVTLRY